MFELTYCIDFFRKFKKDGNFCGLDKSQVSRLTAYLEIVEQLMKQKIPEEQIYENFTVSAATPLIAAKGDAHTEGLNFVTTRLKEGKRVTNDDVQTTLKSCSTTTSPTDAPPVTAKDTARKEKYGGKDGTEHDHIVDANKTIPPITDSTGKVSPSSDTEKVSIDTPTVRESLIVPPPCQSKQPCPGGENHVFHAGKDSVLGDKCEISGAFIRDAKYCPILEQERRKVAGVKGEQFHPASMEMARTDTASRPIHHESANPSSQGIPQVKTGNPQTLTLTFSDKQWAVLKQIQREGLADSFEDAILWLVDEKAAELESGN